MAKQTRPQPLKKLAADKPVIPQKFQHLAALIVLVLSLVIFLNKVVFEHQTFFSPDNIASMSFQTYLKEAEQLGEFPLWNPYIFCGMPAYGSLMLTGDRWFDLSGRVFTWSQNLFSFLLFNPPGGWVIFYYLMFGIGVYWWTWRKTDNKIGALVAGIGVMFSMQIILWLMAGHNTKPAVLAFLPYLFIIVDELRKRFSFLWLLLLVLAFHLSFMHTHIQMMYYSFMAVGLYLFFFMIRELFKKEPWKRTFITGLLTIAAFAVGLAMNSDRYLSTLEYNPYSTRGTPPITEQMPGAETKTVEGGLDYEYATQWSFAPSEMMGWFIPSWFGFGNHKVNGQMVYTYWGSMPFTDAPQYMGISITILAFIGIWMNRRNPFVWFLTGMSLLSLLLSFGKEFPLLYDLAYKYLPYFNKFRVPSMILALLQTFVPVLAGFGIASLMKKREEGMSTETVKKWTVTLGVLATLFFISIVGQELVGSVFDSIWDDATLAQRLAQGYGYQSLSQLPPEAVSQLQQQAAGMKRVVLGEVQTDVTIGILLLGLTLGVVYLFMKRSVGSTLLVPILIVIVCIDLWRIAYKPKDTQPSRQGEAIFAAPEYVKYLQKDTTVFRVLQFQNGQPPFDNSLAYWKIRSAYGYSGSKMRSYQDLVDVASIRNPILWMMMGVKYIISNDAEMAQFLPLVYNGRDMKVYSNPRYLEHAFFVQEYKVADGLEILQNMRDLKMDPAKTAYFMEEPNLTIDPPEAGAGVSITRYEMHKIEMQVNATGNNLLFISESNYPEGWKAFLGDDEVQIHRLNYHFRGVVVPPGSHTLVMKFEPAGFALGRSITLGLNILLIGSLLGAGFFEYRKKKMAALPAQQVNEGV